MEQFGQVIESRGDKALVRVRRHEACKDCGRCGGALGGPDTKDSLVEVSDPLGVAPGMTVRLEGDDSSVLKASFIVYIIPLLAFIAGVIVGQNMTSYLSLVWNGEIAGLLLGFVFMGLTYWRIRQWDNRLGKDSRYQVKITDIVEMDLDKVLED